MPAGRFAIVAARLATYRSAQPVLAWLWPIGDVAIFHSPLAAHRTHPVGGFNLARLHDVAQK